MTPLPHPQAGPVPVTAVPVCAEPPTLVSSAAVGQVSGPGVLPLSESSGVAVLSGLTCEPFFAKAPAEHCWRGGVFGSRVSVPIRSETLHSSLVSQLDGFTWTLGRMRLERDVLAPSARVAMCPVFGLTKHESASAYGGLYVGAPCLVEAAVHRCVAQHGRGVFVVIDPGPGRRAAWQ